MGFQLLASSIVGFAGTAEQAAAILPGVFRAPETDIALRRVKNSAYGILAIGGFRTVESPPGHQPRQFRNGNAEELVFHDVVDALLPVGDYAFQPFVEPPGDFP